MRGGALLLAAALLGAGAARADDPGTRLKEHRAQPLSREDQELVKELALLEKMELVKNLELFEEEKDVEAKAPPPERRP